MAALVTADTATVAPPITASVPPNVAAARRAVVVARMSVCGGRGARAASLLFFGWLEKKE
jgi:hypothetical protein